jgi:methionyl-tRNA formyltransferase
VPALRTFAEHVACVLVVTQPDRPAGRGHKLAPTPVKIAARELGIPTLEPERLRDAFETLAAAGADLFAVASYGKIVPQRVLDLPRLAALNVHPSLLPLYRGATPLQSQLRDGVTDGGVTIIAMDAGMDTGDVVVAERSAIGSRETYGELHDRFAMLGADLLGRALDDVLAGRARRLPQSLFGSAADAAHTLTRPLAKADLEIDWSAGAREIVDRVRSLAPAPGARARFAGIESDPVKILEARVAEPRDFAPLRSDDIERLADRAPGTLADGGLVATGGGYVVLERLVPPGRAAQSGVEYARAQLARDRAATVTASATIATSSTVAANATMTASAS